MFRTSPAEAYSGTLSLADGTGLISRGKPQFRLSPYHNHTTVSSREGQHSRELTEAGQKGMNTRTAEIEESPTCFAKMCRYHYLDGRAGSVYC